MKTTKILNFITVCMLVIKGSISMQPLLLRSALVEGLILAILTLSLNWYFMFSKKAHQ
jgi:hypothetical protein